MIATIPLCIGFIDYDKVMEIAMECKPKMIIAGASAYARTIDFKKFREIADTESDRKSVV